MSGGGRRKRERPHDSAMDEDYFRSKRILQEGFRSMSIEEPSRHSSIYGYSQISEGNGDDQSVADMGEELRRQNSETSTISEEESDDERSRRFPSKYEDIFVSAIKGGRRQYVRKVDFLVDELIRKTQRTCMRGDRTGGDYETIYIPSNVGPQPTTDHALALLLPPALCDFKSIAEMEQEQEGKAKAASRGTDNDRDTDKHGPAPLGMSEDTPKSYYSGNVTHDDWDIEELAPSHSTPQGPTSAQEETDAEMHADSHEEEDSMEGEEGVEDGSDMAIYSPNSPASPHSDDSPPPPPNMEMTGHFLFNMSASSSTCSTGSSGQLASPPNPPVSFAHKFPAYPPLLPRAGEADEPFPVGIF
eukprot:gene31254-37766_t